MWQFRWVWSEKLVNGYEVIHDGHGYGLNTEGECILEFTVTHDLLFGNSFQQKR